MTLRYSFGTAAAVALLRSMWGSLRELTPAERGKYDREREERIAKRAAAQKRKNEAKADYERRAKLEPQRDQFPSRQTYRAAHRQWVATGKWRPEA